MGNWRNVATHVPQESWDESFGFLTWQRHLLRTEKILNVMLLLNWWLRTHKKRKRHMSLCHLLHFQYFSFYIPRCCHCNCQLWCNLFISPRGWQLDCFPCRSVSILCQLDVSWILGHTWGVLWSRSHLSAAFHDLSYLLELLISDPQRSGLVQDEAQSWKILNRESIFCLFVFFFPLNTSSYMSRATGKSISYVTAPKYYVQWNTWKVKVISEG